MDIVHYVQPRYGHEQQPDISGQRKSGLRGGRGEGRGETPWPILLLEGSEYGIHYSVLPYCALYGVRRKVKQVPEVLKERKVPKRSGFEK